MEAHYLTSIAQDRLSTHQSSQKSALHQKLANISTLAISLSAAVEELETAPIAKLGADFDFYQEVERFQVGLIKSALRLSGGSQVKAARLLKLNPTTLNAKIKTFKLLGNREHQP